MDLKLRPKEECKFDEISLGEIMLRLDPGEGRIKTSRTFRAWEGGGDSFASGLIYGLMTFGDAQQAVNYGVVHGALAMTTPGDTSMASLKEVEAKVHGAGARVQR